MSRHPQGLLALLVCLALAAPALAGPPPPPAEAVKPAVAPAEAAPALTRDQQRGVELGKKLIAQLETMFKLIAQNKGDCDKAMKAVTGWMDELAPELQATAREMDALEKRMPKADAEAVGKLLQADAEEMMRSLTPAMMEFIQACPAQMEALGKQLERLTPKDEPPPPAKAP